MVGMYQGMRIILTSKFFFENISDIKVHLLKALNENQAVELFLNKVPTNDIHRIFKLNELKELD